MKNLLRTETAVAFLSLCIMALGFSSCSEDDDNLLSQKQISSFVFLQSNNFINTNVTGLIDESAKTITAFIPNGSSLIGLLPTIAVSEGATVSPTLEQDFSNPIDYTVTAADGSTTTYTATVLIALSQREILQILMDENPGNTLGWDLPGTTDLGTLSRVTTDISGNIIELRLSDKSLTVLVPEIGQLSHLIELILFDNAISSIPSEIGLLHNLEKLLLYDNNITTIPSEFGQLNSLANLNISLNSITSLPSEIGQLSSLVDFETHSNGITSLPQSIGNLSNLRGLVVSNNQLTNLPDEIWQLTSLQTLSIGRNQITSIPKEIENLSELRCLNLRELQLGSIRQEIGNIITLDELDLQGTGINTVPSSFGQLVNLVALYLTENPITSIPQSVCDLQISNGGVLEIFTDPGEECP